ncbi:MAG: AraC family transcriptional regulator [Bacteroidetes bacterium]|nr:MAG: AraC family transcriptional regulator [Bacteroidota bacterium]
MVIFIKNMVCHRCILAVKAEAERLGIHNAEITLGQMKILESETDAQILEQLKLALCNLGFEIIDDKKSRLIEQVKTIVIEGIHHSNGEIRNNWSELISAELQYEYNYISNLFSSIEGITIEQFVIRQKIEKVKELLFYDELTLSEIAYRMGYSSAAYLTNQFKKITGMTPGQFRKLLDKKRNPIDKL